MSNDIYESLKIENACLNQLYRNAMLKMKKMHTEYESLYLNYLNENQQREDNIKNNYYKYQALFQKQFKNEEKNYLEEINNLKLEINEKNQLINNLQNNISELKDKLSKNELIFHLKEKEYQKELLKKDRLLIKSSDVVKKNSKEVMDDIKKLKDELKYFQNKINMMNNDPSIYNNIKTINSNSNSNYYKRELSDYKIRKSPSYNNIGIICTCDCHKNELNKSYFSNETYNFKKNPNSLNIDKIGNSNDSTYIIILRNKINNLQNIIRKKDKEILFWKNLRKGLNYKNNILHRQNYDNILSENKLYQKNNTNNIINSYKSSNNKNNIRSYSHSSSQFYPAKKNIKINLINSNMNPIDVNLTSKEEK